MNTPMPQALNSIADAYHWKVRQFATSTVFTHPGWYVQLDASGLAKVEHTTPDGAVIRLETAKGAGAAIRACTAAVKMLKAGRNR